MNRKTRPVLIAAMLLAVGSAATLAQTPVDTAWTYQGRLTDGGAPASGNYDLRFSLYLDDQGTIPTGPVLDLPSTVVTGGLFTARLDFGALFAGSKLWLLVEISPAGAGIYTALPLQEITSAPQALFSQALPVPFSASGDVPGPGSILTMTNTDATDGTAVRGQSDGGTGTGVYGLASSATGFNFGGLFETNSPDGRAVRAINNAANGLAVAGRFATGSNAGVSIWSTASSATGVTYGVYGDSLSNSGIGVYGRASSISGPTFGVYGETISATGIGVYGRGSSNLGTNYGVFGETVSETGVGALGRDTAASGANFGVRGESYSTSGAGVYGIAVASTGFNFGGLFETNSPDGRAIRAVNNATSGLAVAGRFATSSNAGIGIWSTAAATSGVCYGVFGDCLSNTGFGGYFQNSAVGGTALFVNGTTKTKTLQILGGSDLAEPFNINTDGASGPARPGMVVIIDPSHPGELRPADLPYDTKVAGVISGANGLQPGMVMKAEGHDKADGEHPVAMTGRVWCYGDASFGPIHPGDRLTTSATPGYAMKAGDPARCSGAVIGKAMSDLNEGKGLVLVLVNLQ